LESVTRAPEEYMRWTLLAVLVITGVIGGCARHKHNADDLASDAPSTLHIVNHHWGDVDIFIIRDGQRNRVGMVTATSDETFTLPLTATGRIGTIQLLAHGVGMPGAISSEAIAIRPGMQIEWALEVGLTRATLSFY
jgi:hypothetical protein